MGASATPDPKQLRDALARQTGETVDVRETHISVVFLAGSRAYKLKKPLVLPFLDYGTAERRRSMCEEEVRLNRRLAPDVYLGVRGVTQQLALTGAEDGDAIDYLVEMRRYADDVTVAAILERGELRREDIARVAERLAQFHSSCRRAASRAGARWVELEVMRNVQELLELAELHAERHRIHALARFIAAFARSRESTFDDRARSGMVRDCHGDLRAEHVILDGDAVSVVDCVEFDPDLRTLDVSDDLAFLVMDLSALGGERFALQLLEDYRSAGGDPGPDALVSFFAVHRALVRAKVLLVRAGQHPSNSAAHGHAEARARELLALAERFAWRARLPLAIVVCGLPASGKSHLAAPLAERAHLPRVSSDLLRKELVGVSGTTRAGARAYQDEVSRAVYGELGRRAAAAVRRSNGVIVDATFRHRQDRAAFAEGFADTAPLVFVQCIAPADIALQRAARRERDPHRVSDADVAVVRRELSSWDALDEVAPARHMTLRTDRPVEQILDDLLDLLDRRL